MYSKKQLLNGHNFNPASVNEQLSIFILSYDSFRTNKKEGRKAYQENGYLASFCKIKIRYVYFLEDTDEDSADTSDTKTKSSLSLLMRAIMLQQA